MNRRGFLLTSAAILAAPAAIAQPALTLEGAVEQAHARLWRERIDPYGVMLDYVGELPTPEDTRLGRPNAIGWWSPIENGPMFTGLYLPAACERARRTGRASSRAAWARMGSVIIR
jgi:hypothetical protein